MDLGRYLKNDILDKVKINCAKIGMVFDENGYTNFAEQNLIMPFENFNEIRNELSRGQGSELNTRGKNKPKFNAIHSSSCLCVNSFAILKQNSRQVDFLGFQNFDTIEFEKKLNTGISRPNLDMYLENSDTIIGVESKYTEPLSGKIPNFHSRKSDVGNLEKYLQRKSELKALPENFTSDILEHYINETDSYYLDVAQLVKHTLGLLNMSKAKHGKKVILVYLYWMPSNAQNYPIYKEHEAEIRDFHGRIRKYIDFCFSSYEEIWETYANNPLYTECIALLRKRYS